MKQALKITFVFFVSVLIITTLASAGNLEKGIKAGMSIANFRGSDVGISDYKVGFVAGGYATYLFHENFAVQLEALYVMKGSVQETSVLDSGEVRLSYIEFPILMKVVFPIKPKKSDKPSYYATDKGFRPGFYAGPTVSLSLKDEVTVGVLSMPVKPIDFGIAFGGCFDFEVGKGLLAFDARYTLGISEIPDVDRDADVRNGCATLMVGYAFR